MAAKFPYPMQAAFTFTQSQEGGLKVSGALGDANRAYRGINQSTYDAYRTSHQLPTRDVADAAPQEIADIYKDYWTRFFCDAIAVQSSALAICQFDCGFNGGATAVLETTEGGGDGHLTLSDIDTLLGTLSAGEDAVVSAYLQNRLDRFWGLKGWDAAQHVWTNRLNALAEYVEVSWRVP